MTIFTLLLLSSLVSIRVCLSPTNESDIDFCANHLPRHQLLIDASREEHGCILWCDILDLSKPIGMPERFPMHVKKEPLIPCDGDGHNDRKWCWKGKCIHIDNELAANFYPKPLAAKRIPPKEISDIETRICNENLTFFEWTINIEMENDGCTIDCEILDTTIQLNNFGRRFHSLHSRSHFPCIDGEHVCQDGMCVRNSLATLQSLKPYTECTKEEQSKKKKYCSERKMYCDMDPRVSDWKVLTADQSVPCRLYEKECIDVPGFEAYHWI